MGRSDEDIGVPELVRDLRVIANSRAARFLMGELLPSQKALERALGIYAGAEKARGAGDLLASKVVAAILGRAASKLGVEEDLLREALSKAYFRKGVANILRGIAENGITRPQRLHAPFMVVWNFTKQCNLRCKHCYANAGPVPAPDELNLDQKMEVLRQLDDAGVAALSFSGGEPLVSRDFWPVAAEAARRGFYVSVATNGTLITRKVAERLREIGVGYVEVSIDSPDPRVHDRFRGVPGAWEAAVRGVRNAKEAGLEVGIATTATKENYRDVPRMVDLALRLGADRLVVFNFVPTGRGREMADLDLSPRERRELLEYLYDRLVEDNGLQVFSTSPNYAVVALERMEGGTGGKNGGGMTPTHLTATHFVDLPIPEGSASAGLALAEFLGGCGAGRIYCSIEHNGDIRPCVFLPVTVGNVLRDGFEKVWRESPILNLLRDRDSPDYACSFCRYRYVCGGCRARAYAYYGSLTAPDPSCLENEGMWEELVSGVGGGAALAAEIRSRPRRNPSAGNPRGVNPGFAYRG